MGNIRFEKFVENLFPPRFCLFGNGEGLITQGEKFFSSELSLISKRRVSKPLSMNTGTIRGIYVRRWRFINEILASRIYLLQEKTSIHTVYRRNKFRNNWPRANRNKSDRTQRQAGRLNKQPASNYKYFGYFRPWKLQNCIGHFLFLIYEMKFS